MVCCKVRYGCLELRCVCADSMFAYRSKSSRVSIPLMRMLYPMGHYGSTGFVRGVSLASVIKNVCDGIYTETLQLRGDK